jgi:hypothetical protein
MAGDSLEVLLDDGADFARIGPPPPHFLQSPASSEVPAASTGCRKHSTGESTWIDRSGIIVVLEPNDANGTNDPL